jgi:ADP-ribose pyrophosphatase
VKERTLATRAGFRGRLFGVDVVTVETEPGVRARREIVRHPGAVAAVAQLPNGRFAFVRQYRKPAERRLLEIVAGCRHPGEAPAQAIRREVREETGHRVLRLRRLGRLYPSPGYCDEVIHLYHVALSARPQAAAPDDDERIAVVYLARGDVEDRIARGMIEDGKSLAAWLRFTLAEARRGRLTRPRRRRRGRRT